jgi:hypothetical protein
VLGASPTSPGRGSRSRIIWRNVEKLCFETKDHPEDRSARGGPDGCDPGGHRRPDARTSNPKQGASNLSFAAGQTIPNLVLVPLGPGNTVTFYNRAGTVNVLGDLVGYFA